MVLFVQIYTYATGNILRFIQSVNTKYELEWTNRLLLSLENNFYLKTIRKF